MSKKPLCLDCGGEDDAVFATLDCKQKGHRLHTNYEYDDDKKSITAFKSSGDIVKFRELDPKFEGQKKVVKCKIIAVNPIQTFDIYRVFVCAECQAEYERYSDEFRDIANKVQCIKCNLSCHIDKSQTKTANIRQVLLQEFFEEAAEDKDGNINPRSEEGVVTGDNVYRVFPGQDVVLEVVFRSVKDKATSKTNKILLDILRLRLAEEIKDTKPTEAEIEIFKRTPREKFIKSFAPEIWGMVNEKLALILGILGGNEVDDLRGIINVLMLGDPSMGKSRLLMFCKKVVRKSAKVSGRMTSAAGLVAGIDERDGNRYPVIGPVGLCHNGIVCIDEFEKMNESDRSALHDVMESNTISLHKVGVNMTIPAKTTILAAANPKASRYDIGASIRQNINLPDSLIARFALLFLTRDNLPRHLEEQKVRHSSRVRVLGSLDKLIEQDGLLTLDDMRKFIAYCKGLKPILTEESQERANKYYLDLKYLPQDNGSIPIDMRTQEDLLRLATAFAKFTMSDMVTSEHVDMAWNLLAASLESFEMKTKGEQIASTLQERHQNKDEYVEDCFKSCVNESGQLYMNDVIAKLLENDHFVKSNKEAHMIFQKYNDSARVMMSIKPGWYTWHER